MSLFSIVAPRAIHVGGGTVATIATVLTNLGLSHPLIVTDPVMVSTGLLKRCTDPLDAAGIAYIVFSETIPEPEDTIIEAGVARLVAGNHDCLLAFGGGSPIDTAKAMAILAQRPGAKMREFRVPVQNDTATLPVIAIPTTAGTGSECTRFTVITDTERGEKMLIAGMAALPFAAIVDYELTYTVPPRTTADTGVDSLTHALEAYVSKRANPVSDALALGAMALIGANLRTAYAEPRNAAAREGMMLGATQAGLAFSNSSVALVHGMSRPIGARFHVPHGLSNAMLLPAITRFGLQAAPVRYAAAARAAGFAKPGTDDATAGTALCHGLDDLNRDLKVPTPQAHGIAWEEWEAAMDTMADQAIASGSPGNNPRVPDKAEIVALYRQVFAGSNQ
ncbi:iron-containing alcohol dehydrogenase [Acidisphaera sp. L21]|uniref:iron-containing alcohol dehydrogenase n=1 Tax=Acidisphaera sp. L21 TaxID=1641851 RepID=UPI00131C7398|nr:iron-containing alcohol dehydrogenase [Acidisphaera sp. L21]